MRNLIKTVFLLTLMTVLGVFSGHALGGRPGMIFALGLGGLTCLGLYWASDRIVLAMHRAQPLTEDEAPEVFEILRDLSEKAGIPTPRLFMLPSAAANAFATGRDPRHSVIAVTHGLVGLLNKEELSGVLGHELAHVLHRDSLLASVVATLAGALSMIASMFRWSFFWGGERDDRDRDNPLPLILFVIMMPFVAALIRLSISRVREYGADERGARFCGNPLYLASALRKIEAFSGRFPLRDAVPATAHLFITYPLSIQRGGGLFNTHPSVEDRVARLEAMAH